MPFIMPSFLVFLVFLLRCFTETSSSCQSDRNQDHRPRVNCTDQGLTAVPDGIHTDTQVLLLTGNHFTSLSWSMFSGFSELHELDLSHNLLSTLEPSGPVLEKLSILRLSGNRLTGLGGQVFHCAPSLMEIYLDRNRLRSLHDGTFSELPLLEIIDLSQNKLPALPPRLLERVSSDKLKTFDLENNSVSLMPDGFFSSKPELPYVYLTHNPWLCSCSVTYLHSFLNDQSHNIYRHNGSNTIIPDADSVVCSRPVHLLNRPIIDLEESDFCPPDPPDPAFDSKGDQDFRPSTDYERPYIWSPSLPPDVEPTSLSQTPPNLTTTSVQPVSSTQTPTAPYNVTIDAHLLNSTKSWTSFETYVVTETYGVTWTWTWLERWVEYFTWAPTANPYLTSQDTTEPSTLKTDTSRPTPNSEAPTSALVITRSQHPDTTFNTFQPITVQSQPQSTELASITFQSSTRVTPLTAAGPHRVEAQEAFGRLLPWCWWLFAGFLFLCILSALTSCLLFLWLLRSYLVVYRRLKRHVLPSQVTLRAFRRSSNTLGLENQAETVSFLPLEQIRAAQAVFRSVLFISRDELQSEDSQDASSAAERDKQQVFRKTLHREITTGEEAGGWTEEEGTARYSLVLTEERGLQMERRWLVGAWEMDGRGVACERLCSLIGQPSERTTDGQGLVSSIIPMLPSQ